MFAKSTRAAATVLLGVILTATAAGESQPPDPYQTYRAAVAVYTKTGDIARAVVPLQRWSGVEFDAAIKATLAAKITDDLESAAIFHLEIASRWLACPPPSREATSTTGPICSTAGRLRGRV